MSNLIKLNDGREVSKEAYVNAKLRDLKEFGYSDLTKQTVLDQLEAILKSKKLTVIGMFMEDDISGDV